MTKDETRLLAVFMQVDCKGFQRYLEGLGHLRYFYIKLDDKHVNIHMYTYRNLNFELTKSRLQKIIHECTVQQCYEIKMVCNSSRVGGMMKELDNVSCRGTRCANQ